MIRTSRFAAAMLVALCATGHAQPLETKALRVGYSPSFFLIQDIQGATAAIEVWINSVSRVEMPGLSTDVRIFESFPAMQAAINAGEVDVAGLLPPEYLQIKDKVGLSAGLVGATQDEGPLEKYVLVGRRGRSLAQHRGGVLAVSIGRAFISVPQTWLSTLLLRDGLPESEDFFSAIEHEDQVFPAIRRVMSGDAALCILTWRAFTTAIDLNPQLSGDLEVLATSPGFCRGIALFRDSLEERVRTILQQSLLALHTEPEGAQILSYFRTEQLIAFETEYLDSVEELLRTYETLKAKKGP